MADCNDVSAALARLEAKIDACAAKQIDEEKIVQKSKNLRPKPAVREHLAVDVVAVRL